MTREEAEKEQVVIDFTYWGFDECEHQGQVMMNKAHEAAIKEVFELALEIKFPIGMAVLLSGPRFNWSDDKSMEANNTSGFNYRPMVSDPSRLSSHALGHSIDINPMQNPYIKDDTVLPPGATHDPSKPGAFHPEHPIVLKFKELGFEWGGEWTSLKDYHHFEFTQSGKI